MKKFVNMKLRRDALRRRGFRGCFDLGVVVVCGRRDDAHPPPPPPPAAAAAAPRLVLPVYEEKKAMDRNFW